MIVERVLDENKMQFITDYVIAARRGGRARDLDGTYYRQEIVNVAADLYDRAFEASLLTNQQ